MHPTPTEELRAVRYVLERAAHGEIDSNAAQQASARLRKLERRWTEAFPFLHWDNRRLEALLGSWGIPLPERGRSADRRLANGSTPWADFDAVHEYNKTLRGALASALREPTVDEGFVTAAAAHLGERLTRDPTRPSSEDIPDQHDLFEGSAFRVSGRDETLDESFPLSPLDDQMIHQTPDPVRIMWTSDLQAYERFWTVCHDHDGRVLVAIGGSAYPSLDLAEAYAIVNVDGDHRSVRAGRPLGSDRSDMHVGPIQPTVIRGLRQWRYVLEPNEWGISFDLMFYDTTRQTFREPLTSPSRQFPGRQRHVTTGFESFGVVEGRVTVDDNDFVLSTEEFSGTRDRHWGIGRGVGGPAFSLNHRVAGGSSGNTFVAFEDFAIWGDRVFYRHGDPRPGSDRVRKIERRVRFEPDTQIFVGAEVDYELSTGQRKTLRFRRIGQQTAYLRCGFYGGTPDGRHYQGLHATPNLLEGDRTDLNDPAARRALAGLDEHQCRVECDGETTIGIFQPIDPDAYEACVRRRPGWSFLDDEA